MSNQILIYGYGREGQSTERFLYQHHYPEVIDVYDQKTHPIKIDWQKYDQIWLSPGVPPEKIPEDHRHKLTSQADYFFYNLSESERKKVIAITGSKGKTSTTEALNHFLTSLGHKSKVAGNIGDPLLDQFEHLDELDFLVAEISSFQAEFIRRSPHTVVFLNLFGDHLDRHGDLKNYLAAKSQLWQHQLPGDHLIVAAAAKEKVDNPDAIIAKPLTKKDYPLASVLDADHFRQNLGVLPAVAETLKLKFTKNKLKKALETTPLPPHRLEYVDTWNQLDFYDDAIATNPTATMAAVEYFDDKLGLLILGGKSSEDDPMPLLNRLKKLSASTHIVVTDSPLSQEIKAAKTGLTITVTKDLPEALKLLRTGQVKLSAGKVVLLSPAAKSFDKYPNYETKGDHFKKLVTQLKG